MEHNNKKNEVLMEKVISLCKRRGLSILEARYTEDFGTWDFGHFGVALKKNIKDSWWKKFVESRTDM